MKKYYKIFFTIGILLLISIFSLSYMIRYFGEALSSFNYVVLILFLIFFAIFHGSIMFLLFIIYHIDKANGRIKKIIKIFEVKKKENTGGKVHEIPK